MPEASAVTEDSAGLQGFTWGDLGEEENVEAFDPRSIDFEDFVPSQFRSGRVLTETLEPCTIPDCAKLRFNHEGLPIKDNCTSLIDKMIELEGALIYHRNISSSSTSNSDGPTAPALSHFHSCCNENRWAAVCHFYDLQEAEAELHSYASSQTDPVGKFMRKLKITPAEAIRLNIHCMLLEAPRKQREKYGKRKDVSAAERICTCRSRNREHAKATRMRKRIFREVKS